jgi:hypothetical protein
MPPLGVQAAIKSGSPPPWGPRTGCKLTTLLSDPPFSNEKPKSRLLPTLIVLFLISYGLLTVLVMEQGRIIEVQRFLIGQLFGDSIQLTTMKGREILSRQRAAAATPAPAGPNSQVQAPSTQEKPQGKQSVKQQRPVPQKPPKNADDASDVRRVLVLI